MDDGRDTISIMVASEQYLSRLGVRTILSVIGIEGNIVEYNSARGIPISEINISFDYLIISSFIYDTLTIRGVKISNDKLLLINESRTFLKGFKSIINVDDERTEVLTKFQQFFMTTTTESNEEDGVKNILSDREIDVLKLVAKGYINKEISDELCISINTVITHRKNITEKLSIKTISGLTVYAMLNGYITADDVKKG
ncbi:MAG: response regulator transcription factor [Bacteroidales bacterium]